MSLPVVFSDKAEKDLQDLFDYICVHSSPHIALDYVTRIRKECLSLTTMPHRGTPSHTRKGEVRKIGFEKSATIGFRVESARVLILRVFYRGVNVSAYL